jgi:hypothetical protein
MSAESILMLLSDDETPVSTAETAVKLASGDEYLDLEKLDRGVQKATDIMTAMGRVLPKKAVHADTWKKIQALLATPHTAGAHPGT